MKPRSQSGTNKDTMAESQYAPCSCPSVLCTDALRAGKVFESFQCKIDPFFPHYKHEQASSLTLRR